MSKKALRVLWIGLGNSRVAYYRCLLPALYLGQDWMGVAGAPPSLQYITGYVEGDTKLPRYEDYDVIVLQQPRGRGWLNLIREVRAKGIVVLYEVDDHVHSIAKLKDHDFAEYFQRDGLQQMELCMRECDGMIVTTEYIARRYRKFNKRIWVCPNGLDMGRYRLTMPPERGPLGDDETVTLMWSGATGHRVGVEPWLDIVERVMRKYPHVCFASIGQDFTSRFKGRFEGRLVSIPFAALETYPAAMMLGDIALAPAGKTGFYAGKSDLRALEAAALGIPIVADPHYADAVQHGYTGFIADSPAEVFDYIERLIQDKAMRLAMGAAARAHAGAEFDMRFRRDAWTRAIIEAVGGEVPDVAAVA